MEAEIPMKSFFLKFLTASVLVISMRSVSAKTDVDIRGMKSKTEAQILRLIGGRLVYIREKQASPWRADDAAFMVESILRDDGFYEAEVRGVVESPDLIALIVDEGQRLSLGPVTITGGGDAESLEKTFITPFQSGGSFGTGAAPFRADDVNKGLEFVTRQLQSQGYWNAVATLSSENIDKETGEVSMTVDVDPGPLFTIGRPSVKSPDGRGVKRAATTWESFIGQPASTENVNGLRAAVEEAFTSRGYPDAKITMIHRLGRKTYFPHFVIDLGTRVKLLEVKMDGLVRTTPERIEQIMAPLKDDWYDQAAMNKKIRQFLGTGAFESARIETSYLTRGRIDATLHFQEAKAKEITLAAGAGSFNGPIFRAGYIDRNFRGQLRGFSAGMEVSGRGLLGELKLTDPWWRGTDILRTQRFYSLIKAYDGYTTYENGLETGWKMDLADHYSMELILGYSFVTVSEEGLPSPLLGDTNYNHTRMVFTQEWDYRDSKILPKSGWHVSVPIQIGVAVGKESNSYTKFGIDGGYYHPINDTWNLGIGGFANLVKPSGEIRALPVDLRVFNGGARSVRSFPERELGPSVGDNPYGGDFSWALNTELTRKINGSVNAVAFIDTGAVTGNYIGNQQGGLEIAAGLGVRLDLPIGPVRLEYGYNLTQDPGEPIGTFHFAIGSTF